MKSTQPILLLVGAMLLLLFGGYWWMSRQSLDEEERGIGKETRAALVSPVASGDVASAVPLVMPLRLGVIPEQNVFEMRERYRPLQDYLSDHLHRPVELAMVNSYQAILDDFSEKKIDAAFLGSLVTVLAMDRLHVKVLLKTVMIGGDTTYTGVLFVREESPIQSSRDLAGRSIGLVRTTTGGNLFPIYWMLQQGVLNGQNPPKIVWIGSHDEVIRSVAEGKLDAGAVKSTWLDSYDRANDKSHMRRLAVSRAVPNNALVVRADLAEELAPKITPLLLEMHQNPAGKKALAAYGAERFVDCPPQEYEAIDEMIERIGADWSRLNIPGAPPKLHRN